MASPVSTILIFFVLCSSSKAVLPRYLPAIGNSALNREDIILNYFNFGFATSEIALFLASVHGLCISLRHLKRILRRLGCTRRRHPSDINEVVQAVEEELRGTGSLLGYRAMHQRLINQHGLVTSREVVRHALRIFDPQGVEQRSRHRLRRRVYRCKGPNYLWHIDGYDKLKPFGFCIHGAIDGFSRRIIWLEVASSNNDPQVVAHHFLDYAKQLGGTARIIRGDRGTENVNIAAIQRFFRRSMDDDFAGDKSFMFGKSTSNQRIEAWWGRLRQGCADWWMEFFKDLRDSGLYCDDNIIHCECLKFCFMDIIQSELHRAAEEWNVHRIRPSSNVESPSGKPDILYFVPGLVNSQDYVIPIDLDEIEIAEDLCAVQPQVKGCSPYFKELAEMIMDDEGIEAAATVEEASRLYIDLLDYIDAL
ncbi:uncharacterized protein [Montipora capricornis]|uniref:uncharacterized protein n=1 Tax=Montipora capricornis TaxID=246305 RepID=UPI0035F18C51